MKKRKLFLGIALASVSLFSLAACNNGATSSASTSAPTSQPQAETFTATLKAIVDGELNDTILTTKSITSANGKFAEPSDEAMAAAGYEFEGFYTDVTCATEYDFNQTVTANADIYCKYHKQSVFDEISSDAGKIASYTFEDQATVVTDDKLSFDVSTPTFKIPASDVELNGTGVVLKKKNAILAIGSNYADKAGLYRIYFEGTFSQVVNKLAFFQIDGSSASKANTEVFGIRTVDGKFAYRFDGGDDVKFDDTTALSSVTNKFLVELNTAKGTISVTMNDTKLLDAQATTISKIRGIKFACKTDGSTQLTIDNVAMSYKEDTKTGLVLAKETAAATIDAYLAGDAYAALKAETATDAQKALKAFIDAQVTKSKTAINSAADEAGVTAASTEWSTFEAATKCVVSVLPYTAASTAAEGLDATYFVTLAGSTIDTSKVAYQGYDLKGIYTDAALSTEFAATTTFSADQTLYAKVEAKAELSEYVFEASSITTATKDQDKIAAGTVYFGTSDFFALVSNGNASLRAKQKDGVWTVSSVELDKKFSNYFVITTTKACTIVIKAASTGTSNTTSGFGVYTDDKGTTLASGVTAQSVTGVDGEDLTFTISAAGTYYIGYTESSRNGRIISITVSYQ